MTKNKKFKLILLIFIFIIATTFNTSYIYCNNIEFQNNLKLLINTSINEEIIHGFKKIKIEFVSDYQTNAYTYEHIKTGAKVLVINNGDEEKFFTIGFKTAPTSNSGATHVFEHATLQGSKNYPLKSMLTTIGSTSMATYFNAATSDDFTFYPFGSLNEKDFYNLMNLYLDGIFYPMVMTDKNVFKRDGIRIDVKDGNFKYNGVVFNEMKNSYYNINSILYNSIKQSLYPDTYYKYVSGGTPESIVDLTYEDIIQLHNEAYHPSNSLTILYGNQNLEKSLELLNKYFKDYDKKEIYFKIGYQTPYTELKKYYSYYPVSNDSMSNETIMALNYVIPENHNYEQILIDTILIDLLMVDDMSPLKKAIAESGLTNSLGATSNYFQVNQGSISFYSMNIKPEYEDIFVELIESSLKKIKYEGFNQDYIDSVFNAYQYSQYSSLTGKNIGYKASISAISGWMYKNDISIMLDNKAIYNKLKNRLNSEVFEKAIDELFLNNNFKSLAVIKPDKDYETRSNKKLNDKLNLYKSSLTLNEISKLENDTKEFYAWENTPDSKEAIKSIPSLSISDISSKQKVINYSEPIDLYNSKIIHTYLNTNGISNIILSFDASTIPQNKLQYLQLLATMLGNTATQKYNKQELLQKKLNYLGSFDATLVCVNSINDNSIYTPRFNIIFKTLSENEENALILVEEMLNKPILNDKSLVKRNLQQLKLYYEQSLLELSVPLADYLSEAMTSESGKLKDYIEGYEFYKFICELLIKIDNNWDKIYSELNDTKKLIFNRNGLVIGYTSPQEKQKEFIAKISPVISSLDTSKNKKQSLKFKDYKNSIAITAPTTTLSVNQVGSLKQLKYKYNGDMTVLSNIISKGYLWAHIREEGGAYHAGMSINSGGLIRLLSYADPNLTNTIDVYKNIPNFLNNIENISQDALDKFIIKTASGIDNILQDYNLWDCGINNYIAGYDLSIIYKQKQQILDTKIKDIKNYSNLFKKLNDNPKYIVIGNKDIIYKNKDLFEEIISMD